MPDDNDSYPAIYYYRTLLGEITMKILDQYSKEKPRQFEEIFIVELTEAEIIALSRRYINKNLSYAPLAEKTLNDLRDLVT
mgnify:CR=1 FL=1